jgi:acylphosphatase
MRRRVHFVAKGRVQGVAYRASARDRAHHHGVVGWVRNLPSGDVEGLVEGEASAVDSFLAWAAKGPPGAYVDELQIGDEEVASDLTRFEIRR